MFSFTLKEILASSAILAGIFGSYFGTQMTTDAKISEVKQDVAVQEVQQNNLANEVEDLQTDVHKLDDKIDALLQNRGIDPKKFETISTYEGN